MKPKTWAKHKVEMQQADRKEWFYVISFASTVMTVVVLTIAVFGP